MPVREIQLLQLLKEEARNPNLNMKNNLKQEIKRILYLHEK